AFSWLLRPRRRRALFPYTTLFRSRVGRAVQGIRGQAGRAHGATSGATIKPGTGGRGGRPRCSLRPRRFVALSAAPGSHRDAEELDRKSTRLNSSHVKSSYAVFCLK